MLSTRHSRFFTGRGLFTAPTKALTVKGYLCTTACHKSSRGTVFMEPATKPSRQKVSLRTAPQLQPLARQPVKRRRYTVTDSAAKVRKRHDTTPNLQHMAESAPAKSSYVAKQAVDAGASASESMQQLVPNKAFPFIKHAGHATAEGLHKPIGLILASAYLLGTVCQMSGIFAKFVQGRATCKAFHCALSCLPHLQVLRLAQTGCQP